MKKILSLMALLLVMCTTTWADDVKVTWAMGESTEGAAEPATVATDIKYSLGTGFSDAGTQAYSDITFSKFNCTYSASKGSNGKHDENVSWGKYIDFSFTPAGGKFAPTKVTFDVIKIGTGDPNIDVDVIDGEGTVIAVASNKAIRRNDGSNAEVSITHSYEVKNAASSDGAVTLRIICGKMASGKALGIANVIVEGVWTSNVKTVIFTNDANWEKVFVWAWNDTENFTGATWPGEELTPDAAGLYTWSTEGNPTKILFNDGGSNKTEDQLFKAGGQYTSAGRVIAYNDYSATFKTDGEWAEVWAYVWNSDDSEHALDDWPGTKMEGANGEYSIAIKAEEAPAKIIFHNNAGEQTPDLPFEDGKAYEYFKTVYTATFKTDAGWEAVNAYTWTTAGEGDEAVTTEFSGAWPGTELTADENGVYTFTYSSFGDAPAMIIFNDGNEGKTEDLKFVNGKAYQFIVATPLYTITEGTVFTAGQTVEVKDGEEVVATIIYSEEGGNDFNAATTELGSVEGWAAFAALTTGNETNGNETGGTFYTIKPVYDGTITIGVRLNGGKKFHIAEDGTDLPAYNGWTIPEASNTTYSFDVKAGSTYKIWCDGSKLGFYGFDYKYGQTAQKYSVIFKTNAGWQDVYAYVWTGEGQDEVLGKWPGTKMGYSERYDQYELSFEAEAAPEKIIFSDGVGGNEFKQTGDLDFVNENIYQYTVELPAATTATFNFADPNFRENIGESMTDTKGYIYNETFTANGATLQITAGSAPSRIYVDSNRGQCLVTYKEYTTLTFRAPAGKVITKIEFTAAGNSNIKNFTASSGAIEDMTWTGKADGVRFTQGGTSYLANAIVTLEAAAGTIAALPEIEYVECANIAAFNALEAGTYAKVTLTNAEIIGKSADGYSTVWVQDATGGAWIQYTSLNDKLQEMTKLNGTVYTIKRATSGNPQMKEAEDTPKSEINAEAIGELTIIEGKTIAAVNVPENLNRVVKLSGATLEETSNTAGTLTLGDETISVNNGNATANQQLCKIADWAKDTKLENVTIVAILAAKSATENVLYPISIELVGETVAEETLNVERYPGLLYTTTEATVDFTAAKAFLGVNEVTTDMLYIINPDGTEISNYSTYDGWFDGEGKAETWGENTKINVKFFQAIPEGTYTICDMNGADEIGNTYTTKWALKANGKSYIYNINVTFVEKPVVELAYDALTIVGTEEEQFEWEVGTCYQDGTATIDVASILNTLNVESLDDVTIYAVQSDGSLDDMYQLGTTDGWRNADGDWQSWGADAYFYVKANFAAEDTQLYSVGTMDPATNTNLANAAEFTARYVFVKNGSTDAVQLNVVVALTEPEPVAITFADLNVLIEQEVSFTFEGGAYQGATADVDVNAILGTLGVESLDDVAIYAVQSNGTLDSNYKLGTTDGWRNENGDWQGWGSDAYFCVKTDFELESGQITYVGTMDGQNDPNTFVAKFVFVKDNETHDAVVLNVIIYYGDLTDGINAVNAKNLDNQVIYNLQGVRLEKLQKGLNIVGGKKIVVK